MELEKACRPVREGDMKVVEELSTPYLRKKKGLLALFRGEPITEIMEEDKLVAASEALVMIGHYREAVKPLEDLISRISSSRVRDLALARIGVIAVSRGLPIDMNPILSEMGMSRRDLGSIIKGYGYQRKRKDDLIELEKMLLRSLLIKQKISWIESDSYQAGHIRSALDGFRMATITSERLSGEYGSYHAARSLLEFGRFLLEAGDHEHGIEQVRKSLSISEREGFPGLLGESLLVLGTWEEDEENARNAIRKAQDIAVRTRNDLNVASSNSILGRRMCENGEKEGIERLLHSSGILNEAISPMEAAMEKGESALWCIRLGDPGRGIDLARDSYKVMRNSHNREELARILCILFFGYMRKDERSKAKKLLMEIVTNHPVKQTPENFAILKEAVTDAGWLRKDKDTMELFEEEIIYTLSRDAAEEIKSRARESYPNEFGAMLRGIEHISHIEPIMEGSANRSSFMFSLFSRFSQRDLPGEGVVHSHPSGSARPSRADVSLFGRFPGINIIIAYPFQDDSMAAYDRMGNRVKLIIDE
jgi:proteasome lid subunit RPN8/RPN11